MKMRKIFAKGKKNRIPPPKVEKRLRGFTLIELLTVVALLSVFLLFLSKLNFSTGESNQPLKLAVKTLAAALDTARSQAIMHNTDICALIDISSSYKFRRIILCRKNMDQNWVAQQIILLSDKIFVLSASALAEYFGKTLSSSFYTEEEFTVNDADIKGYSFVFNNKGVLCNLENNSTLVAVGHGAKNGENIRINNNAPVMGIYVLPLGKQIILESKDIMQEVL